MADAILTVHQTHDEDGDLVYVVNIAGKTHSRAFVRKLEDLFPAANWQTDDAHINFYGDTDVIA